MNWGQFKHLMDRIAARLDASNEVLSQYMTFAKKAMDELNRLHQNSLPNLDVPLDEQEDENIEKEKFFYKGTDLLALGGTTFRERALNIANHVWDEEERMKYCIEPKKTLSKGREKADKERSDVLRDVMKCIMKSDFSEDAYRSILKNVNQQGVDMGFRKRKSLQKENEALSASLEENCANQV